MTTEKFKIMSEFIKDIIKLRKITIKKNNCKKDKDNKFWQICLMILIKILIEKKKSKNENNKNQLKIILISTVGK